MTFQEAGLPVATSTIVSRAANEGVPVAAIARIVQVPFDNVSDDIKRGLASGRIGSMPKPDWPPNAKWAERLPSVPRTAHPEDVEFQCKKLFKLTKLEAGFMMVLLRDNCVGKDKLHGVIEEQRAQRPLRPDKQEATDPKMVDVIICKLRAKLKKLDEAFIITTSWGSGYFIEPDVKQAIFQKLGGPYGDVARSGPEVERGSPSPDPAE